MSAPAAATPGALPAAAPAAAAFDPYLRWSELGRWAGHAGAGGDGWVPLLLQGDEALHRSLGNRASPPWSDGAGGLLFTARVPAPGASAPADAGGAGSNSAKSVAGARTSPCRSETIQARSGPAIADT